MNISLPDSLKAFVDEQVSQRGYGTSSQYVRELIRRDEDRLQMRNLRLAGASSAHGAGERGPLRRLAQAGTQRAQAGGQDTRPVVKVKPVVPREQAREDVEDAVAQALTDGARTAALGFADALENADHHIGRHPATVSRVTPTSRTCRAFAPGC